MAFHEQAKAFARTVESLYGDILDLPVLKESPSAARPRLPSESLSAYAYEIRHCQRCVLHIGRSQLVFGRGDPAASIAFVGDAPSLADDASGQPFSDAAGELLHKMILAMRLKPEKTYLTNLFKCRPPSGQSLGQESFPECKAHLENQFRFLRAPFVVALGETAAKALARSESPLGVLRRQVFDWSGRSVFCTHHPRDLLASPSLKKEAWEDLQAVMKAMESPE